MSNCLICKKPLNVEDDPLSNDCGGDCWGCVSQCEADGLGIDVEYYRKHHDRIMREILKK
jgi:hypothetical protein